MRSTGKFGYVPEIHTSAGKLSGDEGVIPHGIEVVDDGLLITLEANRRPTEGLQDRVFRLTEEALSPVAIQLLPFISRAASPRSELALRHPLLQDVVNANQADS